MLFASGKKKNSQENISVNKLNVEKNPRWQKEKRNGPHTHTHIYIYSVVDILFNLFGSTSFSHSRLSTSSGIIYDEKLVEYKKYLGKHKLMAKPWETGFKN